MKKPYDTVNEKLWNLETRMDRISKDQAESSCAIQSKLDALLRNSIAQDKLVAHKPQGTRVDFVEPQQKKTRIYTVTPDCIKHWGSRVQGCCEGWNQRLDECT